MDLQVFESRFGTKVVTATNLHQALGLPVQQYGINVRRWLRDAYEFHDAIRQPQPMRDFSKRPRPNDPIEDFFITLELAKHIALRTRSKEKMKFARILDAWQHGGQLSLFQQAA